MYRKTAQVKSAHMGYCVATFSDACFVRHGINTTSIRRPVNTVAVCSRETKVGRFYTKGFFLCNISLYNRKVPPVVDACAFMLPQGNPGMLLSSMLVTEFAGRVVGHAKRKEGTAEQ